VGESFSELSFLGHVQCLEGEEARDVDAACRGGAVVMCFCSH